MRRAPVIVATALLALAAGAGAAHAADGGTGSGPLGISRGSGSIMSSAPALSNDLPSADTQPGSRPAAVGVVPDGRTTGGSEGLSDSTVRMLLSSPPTPKDDD